MFSMQNIYIEIILTNQMRSLEDIHVYRRVKIRNSDQSYNSYNEYKIVWQT